MKTIRQQMTDLLTKGPITAIELSGELAISEREVYEHLSHVEQTIKAHGETLVILPAECLKCGFVFKGRRRFTRPGHCPRCKQSHITRPCFQIREK